MAKGKLLASAPSLDAIGDSVARFYCGERKELVAQDDGTWAIRSPVTGRTFPDVRVIARKGRYRFEMVAD